ncbi:MAG TPA: inositol monophosphatase family protein [Baekduia sp.]|uniref:inositol monophosphatase family protein n=1 Tax=Baekduia sp. TaxID=2600305 RepID=UPI002D78584D|nr:inositol monophosphatase family protein [Baekduia sp.]HET6505829.1 inositol monophosphatase family protein [Baekduia sp.]
MSGAAVSHEELLDVAVECARTAGALLKERFGSERVLATKSTSTDVVSAADLAAEAAIREILGRRAPDDAIMGEEGDDTPGTSGRRWIVDPLDGTVNFLYGLPQWCVSVACEGLAAAVFDPIRDELFTATADGPARLNGVDLTPAAPEDLAHALVATGFGYDARRRALQAEVAGRVLPAARDIRRGGSAALDLAWAAAGRLDAYYERGVNLWDIAAGELICARAGLHVERLAPVGELPSGVLAAHGTIADDLRTIVV